MENKKVFVQEIKPKDTIESIFMIKYMTVMEARDGRNYLNIILSDATGDLEARKWHGAEKIVESMSKGDYALVKGKVNQFQNRQQLIISDISKVDASQINTQDFIAKAETPPEIMLEKLTAHIDSMDDVYLRDLLKSIIVEPEVTRRLKEWQAGKTIHHAYHAGLLEHILSCVELGAWLAKHYKLNRNYIIAGCFLHDIGKIYELTDGTNVEYTEEGKLLGHVAKGIELIDRYAARINNFPHDTKIHLKHIVLSHHGEYEYGAMKLPQTSEALLVYLIDLIDSKLNSFQTAKKMDPNIGGWTNYIKHLDRILYKDELPFYREYITTEKKVGTNLTFNMASQLKKFKNPNQDE